MQFPVCPEFSKWMTSHRHQPASIDLSNGVKLFKETEPLLFLYINKNAVSAMYY